MRWLLALCLALAGLFAIPQTSQASGFGFSFGVNRFNRFRQPVVIAPQFNRFSRFNRVNNRALQNQLLLQQQLQFQQLQQNQLLFQNPALFQQRGFRGCN